MDEDCLKICERLAGTTYARQGVQALQHHDKRIQQLLVQRKLPDTPWSDVTVKLLLSRLALMDGGNPGIGENCLRRYYGFSGSIDYNSSGGKAEGSELLVNICNRLLLDILKVSGVASVRAALVLPVATGMALSMSIAAVSIRRPRARYVITARIDQKSSLKCISTAGYLAIVIENERRGDELDMNIVDFREALRSTDHEEIACVLTTTSCFAPRIPNRLELIASLCKQYNIPHIVNNAYGVQSSACMHQIQQGQRLGRIDAFVQSVDKNFMVPVGGSVVAGFDPSLVLDIGRQCLGKGSICPALDITITLLSLGISGYKSLLETRKTLFTDLKNRLQQLMPTYGDRVLQTSRNNISIAITLDSFDDPTMIGSMLFKRNVSGTRVVDITRNKTVCGIDFIGYGSHSNNYPHTYLTAAVTIEYLYSLIKNVLGSFAETNTLPGTVESEIDEFIKKLKKCLNEIKSKKAKNDLPN